MEGRGRKSTAALSVVATSLPQRMEPPQELTEAQKVLWREIAAGKPVDWFAADNSPLLTEYVRAVDMGNVLALQIEATIAAGGEDVGAALKPLLDMRDKEAKRATSIATKLRLTQQSRYTPQAAATANKKAGGGRPWETGR